MYCIKCGVELAESERSCPLCGTSVYHPELPASDGEGVFPPYERHKSGIKRSTAMIMITVVYGMIAAWLLLCDFIISGTVSWSFYASGGMVLMYVLLLLPNWFARPNPVIFVPCGYLAVGLYVLTIDILLGGGWFLGFAFPAIAISGGIVTTVVTLVKYLRRGYLYIFGGAIIASGAYIFLLEFFITYTFELKKFYFWSIYPLSGCILLGLALIVIGISSPLREAIKKKIFI